MPPMAPDAHADLAELIDAWPGLSPDLRRAVLSVVRAAR